MHRQPSTVLTTPKSIELRLLVASAALLCCRLHTAPPAPRPCVSERPCRHPIRPEVPELRLQQVASRQRCAGITCAYRQCCALPAPEQCVDGWPGMRRPARQPWCPRPWSRACSWRARCSASSTCRPTTCRRPSRSSAEPTWASCR